MMVEIIRRFYCDPLTEVDAIQTFTSNEKYTKRSETTTSVVFENKEMFFTHMKGANNDERRSDKPAW